MRHQRMWVVLFLAMASGGLAAYLTLRYLRDQKALLAAEPRGASVIGVAGFVLPGTRVDVVVTLPPRAGANEATTQVFLQNIPTLAAGESTQPDARGKPQGVTVITLLVTPEQAEVLILAANEGRIQLALRNTLDLATVETRGARAASLLRMARPDSGSRRAAALRRSAPPDPAIVIEAYKGGVRTLIKF